MKINASKLNRTRKRWDRKRRCWRLLASCETIVSCETEQYTSSSLPAVQITARVSVTDTTEHRHLCWNLRNYYTTANFTCKKFRTVKSFKKSSEKKETLKTVDWQPPHLVRRNLATPSQNILPFHRSILSRPSIDAILPPPPRDTHTPTRPSQTQPGNF
jgi:hypothetical protein